MITIIKFLIIALVFLPISILAQIELPKLISNGMVLQRDTELTIWGWASANENIQINFTDSTYFTKANSKGDWQIILSKQKKGGPYTMTLSGKNTIIINNILIGDVWLCSGQSNMQLPMRRVAVIYGNEIASSENLYIRQFNVPVKWNYQEPQTHLQGGQWQEANPENINNFSALAYFFARDIYANYKVPIGILLTAAGGSCAEGWISEESLKLFPEQYKIAKQLKDTNYMQNLLLTEREASKKMV